MIKQIIHAALICRKWFINPVFWDLPSFRGVRVFTPFWGVNLNVHSCFFLFFFYLNSSHQYKQNDVPHIKIRQSRNIIQRWGDNKFWHPQKGCRVKCQLLHASIIVPIILRNTLIRKKCNGKVSLEVDPSTVYLICVVDYNFRKLFLRG